MVCTWDVVYMYLGVPWLHLTELFDPWDNEGDHTFFSESHVARRGWLYDLCTLIDLNTHTPCDL